MTTDSLVITSWNQPDELSALIYRFQIVLFEMSLTEHVLPPVAESASHHGAVSQRGGRLQQTAGKPSSPRWCYMDLYVPGTQGCKQFF